MKTLSQEDARTLKAMTTDMDAIAMHQALLGIINHLTEYHVMNQVRLKEIIDAAKKYNDILKKN
jgi:hypothetical protein